MSKHANRGGLISVALSSMVAALTLPGCGGGGSGGGGYQTPPLDTTPPTATVTNTAATVSRTIQLTATAADDRGVTLVEFLVDGTVVGSDASAPYTFDWNSGLVGDGNHAVTARATDAAGNASTSVAVTLAVRNNLSLAVALSGDEEIPRSGSIATGSASLNVNLATGALSATLTLSGVTATAAHVHDGFAGQNGPVVVPLAESSTSPGTWSLASGTVLTAAQLQRLLAGAFYFNAHSAAFPGGEVRGQIVPPGLTVRHARLDGLQQVPSLDSSARAQGAVTTNDASGLSTIHITTANLVTPTAAHLHDGVAGRNGPVLVTLTQDGSDPNHWSAVDQPLTAAALAALQAGGTYLNVHTQAFPNGELRGQVSSPGVLIVVNPLAGAQEVPSATSTGRGAVAVTVQLASLSTVVHVNATGVDGSTGAHLHRAYAGISGPIIVPLTKDAADATHWSATGVQLTQEQLTALQKGQVYANVHTPSFPGGEIRGQLTPDGVRLVFTGLSGAEEVPPVTTVARGTAATTVDLANRKVTIHVRATGVDDATASHIHRAARGSNGPVLIPLTQDPASAGHWLAEEQAVTDSQLADFLAALWYVNVHTPSNPGGKIRGQIGLDPLPIPDTTPPVVALTALPAVVSGTVALAAGATDDVGVASVRFLVDGALLASDATAPYEVSWDTTTHANGSATLRAEAVDAAGNVGQSAPLLVTVNNLPPPPDATPPTISLAAIPATIGGNVTFSADAQDNVGVTSVRFLVNGNVVGTDATAPYSTSFDTRTLPNGPISVTADARDAAGNVTVSAAQVVTIANTAPDTTPPTVSLATLPATVSGTVTLDASASDDTGVTSVRFLVNGNVIATDTLAPYSASWDTTAVANGPVTVRAEASDAAGNTGQSAAQAVTVSNVVAATLSQLQATIFTPRCSGCHTGGGGTLPSSMDLSSTAASFAALVNVASQQQAALMRVKPNDPDQSYLVRKLAGGPTITGSRMPLGGPFLSNADMDRVRSWINSGAPNN